MSLSKGIFWWIDEHLFCRKVSCDANGMSLEAADFTSKSGDNFNHKAEWEKLPKKMTGGKPYDYDPRGRVEIKRDKVTVYLNPILNRREVLEKIESEFGLKVLSVVVIKNDGSAHYRALSDLDNGSA